MGSKSNNDPSSEADIRTNLRFLAELFSIASICLLTGIISISLPANEVVFSFSTITIPYNDVFMVIVGFIYLGLFICFLPLIIWFKHTKHIAGWVETSTSKWNGRFWNIFWPTLWLGVTITFMAGLVDAANRIHSSNWRAAAFFGGIAFYLFVTIVIIVSIFRATRHIKEHKLYTPAEELTTVPIIPTGKNKPKWILLPVLIAIYTIIVLLDGVRRGTFVWGQLAFLLIAIMICILFLSRPKRFTNISKRWLGIGETALQARVWIPASVFALFFSVYVVISSGTASQSSSLRFDPIIISATLGGLVLTGASNKRITDESYDKLIQVARNFISATIFLMVVAVLLSWMDALHGINPNNFECSWSGVTRAICFYPAGICFCVGIFTFSVGLLTLLEALSTLDRKGHSI